MNRVHGVSAALLSLTFVGADDCKVPDGVSLPPALSQETPAISKDGCFAENCAFIRDMPEHNHHPIGNKGQVAACAVGRCGFECGEGGFACDPCNDLSAASFWIARDFATAQCTQKYRLPYCEETPDWDYCFVDTMEGWCPALVDTGWQDLDCLSIGLWEGCHDPFQLPCGTSGCGGIPGGPIKACQSK